MSAVEILQAGRDRLVRDGWTWGTLATPGGERCAVGALLGTTVLGEVNGIRKYSRDIFVANTEELEAATYLSDVASKRMYQAGIDGLSLNTITNFNDGWANSINDVLSLYDDAILNAKEANQ